MSSIAETHISFKKIIVFRKDVRRDIVAITKELLYN